MTRKPRDLRIDGYAHEVAGIADGRIWTDLDDLTPKEAKAVAAWLARAAEWLRTR